MTTILTDTNLWVASFISTSMRERIHRLISDENIIILADAELLEELADVFSRPKFSKIAGSELTTSFLQILKDRLTLIETISRFQVCRDPDDDYLLAICHDGKADYLLTGDNDLLSLTSFGQTRIVTLSDFERLLYSSS